MTPPGKPLSDEALTVCQRCGQPVWLYKTPTGDPVSLDNSPGEMIIDELDKAYRSMRPEGYRVHHCSNGTARAPVSGTISGDEFLWP
jgi:hypothetical protein